MSLQRVKLGAAALLAVASASPAAAEAMRVGDLGPVPSQSACLATAETVLSAYIAEFGGHAVSGDPDSPQEWAIYGWGLRPGSNDVVITCPLVVGNVHAFYTVHASGDGAAGNADMAAERLRELWKEHY